MDTTKRVKRRHDAHRLLAPKLSGAGLREGVGGVTCADVAADSGDSADSADSADSPPPQTEDQSSDGGILTFCMLYR